MQEELMNLCKARIVQGCQSTLNVFTFFLSQALDWVDYEIPSLSKLLVEAIDIANIVPFPQLISHIVLTINRCFDYGIHIAITLLPQL